jgi:glutamate decarboxylase
MVLSHASSGRDDDDAVASTFASRYVRERLPR